MKQSGSNKKAEYYKAEHSYSYSLVIKGIAFCRLQKDKGSTAIYIDSIFVRKDYRKKGIGTKLFLHACFIANQWPEMDVRSISLVAERMVEKKGYKLISKSERYHGCYLWINKEPFTSFAPLFKTISKIKYFGKKKCNTTFFLAENID